MLRYRKDIGPVIHIAIVAIIQVSGFCWCSNLLGTIAFSGLISALGILTVPVAHNHFHSRIFRSIIANRLFEYVMFVQNGFLPGTWIATHQKHHRNYLNQCGSDQDEDPHRWQSADGTVSHLVPYCLRFIYSHRCIITERRTHPKLFREFCADITLMACALAFLASLRPLATAAMIVIPMLVAQVLTAVHSYSQHAGLDTSSHSVASRSYYGPFFLWNIGLHTAHHLKPGLHWSRLPELHERIVDRIPREAITRSYLTPWKGIGRDIGSGPQPKELREVETDFRGRDPE